MKHIKKHISSAAHETVRFLGKIFAHPKGRLGAVLVGIVVL